MEEKLDRNRSGKDSKGWPSLAHSGVGSIGVKENKGEVIEIKVLMSREEHDGVNRWVSPRKKERATEIHPYFCHFSHSSD